MKKLFIIILFLNSCETEIQDSDTFIEKSNSSSQSQIDVDGDGILDGDEFLRGTSPTNRFSPFDMDKFINLILPILMGLLFLLVIILHYYIDQLWLPHLSFCYK